MEKTDGGERQSQAAREISNFLGRLNNSSPEPPLQLLPFEHNLGR